MELWDFIITGTAAYGPQTPGKSDIDIVLMADDARVLMDELKVRGIPVWHIMHEGERYPDGETFYFQLGGLKFNIIQCLDESEFTSWRNRTEYMKKLPPIVDREERLRVFNLNTTGGLP